MQSKKNCFSLIVLEFDTLNFGYYGDDEKNF